jgi:hypothetical protein
MGPLQWSSQSALVGRRNRQSVNLAGDHRIDNLDLAGIVGFIRRPIPKHIHVQVAGSLLDAGVHRNKKQMGSSLGNYTDYFLTRPVAGGEGRAGIGENQMTVRYHRLRRLSSPVVPPWPALARRLPAFPP